MPKSPKEIIPEFTLNGHKYTLRKNDIIKRLGTVVPLEMSGNRKYYIECNGERFPIKQVIAEVTNQPHSSFLASDAYRILLNLGFEVKNIEHS